MLFSVTFCLEILIPIIHIESIFLRITDINITEKPSLPFHEENVSLKDDRIFQYDN